MIKYYEGIICVDKFKKAYCQVNEKETVYIAPKFLNRALHGDKVLLKIKNNYGFVQKVIERNKVHITGQIQIMDNGVAFVKPWINKYQKDFFIKNSDINEAKDGDVVEIEVSDWPKKFKSPIAKVKKVLYHTTSEQNLIYKLNLPTKFPDGVLEEIQNIENNIKEEIQNRIDLRHLRVFSIDPKGSKDLDDALSLEVTDHGYRVGIHIADVTAWMKPGTLLDQEAFKRGCSVYLPNTVVPMIPHSLCENLCSLLPQQDSLAISVMINFDREWNLSDYYIFRSVIHNRHQFTYEEAEIHRTSSESEYYNELNMLYVIGQKIRNQYFPNEFELKMPYLKWEFDENKEPVKIKIKDRIATNDLIQSWMLMANFLVTKKIESLGSFPWVYRVHPEITDEKINNIKVDIKHLNLEWDDSINIYANIKKLLSSERSDIVSDILIKKFRPAYYSPERKGHFALGSHEYAHFTSPIRRYPDVIIHRILLNALDGKQIFCGNLEDECNHLSTCEKIADDAERTAHQLNSLKFIKDVKYPMDGTITSFSKRGITIRTELMVDGFIHAKELPAYWSDDERRWVNEQNWKIGDIVRVKIKNLDWNRREIVLNFV